MNRKVLNREILNKLVILAILLLMMAVLTGCSSTAERAQEAAVKYLDEGKYEKAIEELTTVITKANLDKAEEINLMINGYYMRGDCYTILGDTESAQADYAKALEEDLRDRKVSVDITATRYLRRGLAYLQREDYASALEAFKLGLACGDKSCEQELLRNEICCYERVGEFDLACSEAEKYATAYPQDLDMVNEYNFLVSRQTEAQKVKELLQEQASQPEEVEVEEDEESDDYTY